MSDETAGSKKSPIDYVEIEVLDIKESKDFYGRLLGWTFEDYGEEYAGFHHGGGYGGFQKSTSVKRGSVLVVLKTDDLESMLEKVKDAGSEISKDIFRFPGGRRFQFIDPSGNELAIWAADEAGS